jgi:hypothetical protein
MRRGGIRGNEMEMIGGERWERKSMVMKERKACNLRYTL